MTGLGNPDDPPGGPISPTDGDVRERLAVLLAARCVGGWEGTSPQFGWDNDVRNYALRTEFINARGNRIEVCVWRQLDPAIRDRLSEDDPLLQTDALISAADPLISATAVSLTPTVLDGTTEHTFRGFWSDGERVVGLVGTPTQEEDMPSGIGNEVHAEDLMHFMANEMVPADRAIEAEPLPAPSPEWRSEVCRAVRWALEGHEYITFNELLPLLDCGWVSRDSADWANEVRWMEETGWLPGAARGEIHRRVPNFFTLPFDATRSFWEDFGQTVLLPGDGSPIVDTGLGF